ncbi:Formyltetrahydrofolate deformylase [Zea mays]|uniref:Formyltetrahydrofolate deformylase n=2 Tax=Zea mays TaxID=4577 RepID=A0A1D6PML4_MAIZE|nr:Formyltetrahydrofolate deformylase [Zea mays]
MFTTSSRCSSLKRGKKTEGISAYSSSRCSSLPRNGIGNPYHPPTAPTQSESESEVPTHSSVRPSNAMVSLARRPLSAAVPAGNLLGIHLFRCPDAVGIVAKLSECIASRGGNIHSVDVFVPDDKPVFYSRSEFTYNPRLWPRHELHKDFLNLSRCFNAQTSTVRVPDLDPKYNISILASKQDHCLFDLLYRWQEGRLPVHINCVISNHDRPQDNHVRRFLQRHGIPYHYLPTAPANKREKEILELIQGTDFVVLARYMQILSENLLKAYGKDIINIHHGLLPSFKGGNPSRQAFSAGVKLIGATSHFVTPELDAGPIIEQMVERVSHRDTLQSFVVKSENLEKQCLAEAIKSYCELRVLPYELRKTVVF